MPQAKKKTDFKISNHGSIVLLTPMNAAARLWINENVQTESWQWLGNSIAVEPRYIEALVLGIVEAGLSIA